MRRLLVPLVLLALILGGFWLGGESLLVRQLRAAAARHPMLGLGEARELRDPGRFGIHARAVELRLQAGRIELPQAELWLTPLHPTTLHLALPSRAGFDPGSGSGSGFGAGPLDLGLGEAAARLRLQPLGGMAMAAAGLSAGPLSLQGSALAEALRVEALRVAPDRDDPAGAAAAYDFKLLLDDLDPVLLVPSPLPGRLDLAARGRVWLDALPRPSALAAGLTPLPVGLRLDGAELRLGGLQARLMGRVEADTQGRAQGRIMLYTRDAEPLLQAAAQAGLIPPRAVTLAGAMLRNISALPLSGDGGQEYPPPAEGELRLPLDLAAGRTRLGPITLGPAPAFPRR